MKTCIHTIGLMAIASSLSFAQPPPQGGQGGPGGPSGPGKGMRPPPEEIFKKLDTNNDGSLSLDEFKASPMGQKNPARAEEIFKKMDTNNDGSVSLEEFKAHRPMHRPGGPGGPGGQGGGAKGPDGPPAAPPAE